MGSARFTCESRSSNNSNQGLSGAEPPLLYSAGPPYSHCVRVEPGSEALSRYLSRQLTSR
ncbi:hypothetical protein TIFTF001_006508 [Ficus carica]|uniref:Uncharacterized protein n=1 Tax=Ficus carica TaxID=3494 RepID=A0AA88CYT4_FICCA|nr:hypothetical protein TIFTF001_006508 [Ficus carica]